MYAFENMDLIWVDQKDVYDYTNRIHSAVYAFAWLDKKPKDTEWPYMLQETYYVGMSGGLKNKFIADKKGRNKNPFLSTTVHQRMKQHIPKFNNSKGNFGKEKRKYDLYHQNYTSSVILGKTLYVALMKPKEHVPDHGMRNVLSLVESEQIYLYGKMFKNIPLLNLAEQDEVSEIRKDDNSFSQSIVKDLKDNDVTRFLQ